MTFKNSLIIRQKVSINYTWVENNYKYHHKIYTIIIIKILTKYIKRRNIEEKRLYKILTPMCTIIKV